jgi:hypothetical protein
MRRVAALQKTRNQFCYKLSVAISTRTGTSTNTRSINAITRPNSPRWPRLGHPCNSSLEDDPDYKTGLARGLTRVGGVVAKKPHPSVYAQIVKQKIHGRLHTLIQRVRCGTTRLAQLGLAISTSLIERLNLTMRHTLAPLVRKSGNFCKDREQMRRRVVFFQAFYNFARPHQSLRVELSARAPVRCGLIHPKWHQRTPGMAAGLTDHVWTFRELLTAKCEPILNQSISG